MRPNTSPPAGKGLRRKDHRVFFHALAAAMMTVIDVCKFKTELASSLKGQSAGIVPVPEAAIRKMPEVCKAMQGRQATRKRVNGLGRALSKTLGAMSLKDSPDGLPKRAVAITPASSGR